jgi:predicted Rossmann-fold nucleotide-binding protein
MFEVLTLVQTHKLAKNITVVVYGPEYWKKVLDFDWLVDTGAISPDDIDLFQFADTPEQAFELLKDGLTKNHLEPENVRREKQEAADPVPSFSPEDLLGPDLAKTR